MSKSSSDPERKVNDYSNKSSSSEEEIALIRQENQFQQEQINKLYELLSDSGRASFGNLGRVSTQNKKWRISISKGIVSTDHDEEFQGFSPISAFDERQESIKKAQFLENNDISLETGEMFKEDFPDSLHVKVNNTRNDDEQDSEFFELELSEDTFSLMMLTPWYSLPYLLGFATFCVETLLVALIMEYQVSESSRSTLFNIPVTVSSEVRIGQFIATVLALWFQTDIHSGVLFILLITLLKENRERLLKDRPELNLFLNLILPNFLKACQGILCFCLAFILVLQGDNLVDISKFLRLYSTCFGLFCPSGTASFLLPSFNSFFFNNNTMLGVII